MVSKIVRWLLSLLALSMMACGQMSVTKTTTPTYNLVDNIADCATASDCWHDTAGIAVEVSYAGHGHGLIAITASCEAYVYNGRGNWTAHPEWGCIHDPVYGNDGNLYALYGPKYDACGPTDPGQRLGRWNPNTIQFDVLTYCYVTFHMTGAGNILGVDANGTQWQGSVHTGGWQHSPVFAYPTVEAIPIDDNGDFYSLRNDHAIFSYTTANGLVQIPGAAYSIALSPGPNLDLWATGTDDHVYSYEGSVWNKLAQVVSPTARSLSGYIGGVAAVDSNNKVIQFSSNGLQYQVNIQGTFTCNEPPALEHICTQFTHVVQGQLKLGSTIGHLAYNSQPSQVGTKTFGVLASVTKHDLTSCVENNDCTPSDPTDDAHCTSGASNDNSAGSGGISISNWDFNRFVGHAGPQLYGSSISGSWKGSITNLVDNICSLTGGTPTCPDQQKSQGLVTENFLRWWANQNDGGATAMEALKIVEEYMGESSAGFRGPYEVDEPYVILPGNVLSCLGTLQPKAFIYDYAALPPCQ